MGNKINTYFVVLIMGLFFITWFFMQVSLLVIMRFLFRYLILLIFVKLNFLLLVLDFGLLFFSGWHLIHFRGIGQS